MTEHQPGYTAPQVREHDQRLLIEHFPAGVLVHGSDGRLLLSNAEAEQLLALPSDQMLGTSIGDLLPRLVREDGGPLTLEEYPGHQVLVTGLPVTNCVLGIEGKDHEGCTWVLANAYPESDSSGRLHRVVVTLVNITERKRAEEALRESEIRYHLLFEMESDAIFLIDNESGRILEVNQAASALYGFTRGELLVMRNVDLSAEPNETLRATVSHVTEIPVRYHRKKSGIVFPVEITATHLDFKGRPAHIAAIRDITERRRTEEALRESEATLRSFFNSSGMMLGSIEVFDQDVLYVSANEAAARFFGQRTSSLTNQWASSLGVPPAFLRTLIEHCHRSDVTGAIVRFESEYPGSGGQRWLSVAVNHVGTTRDGRARFSYVIDDITDRKRAELALRESEAQLKAAQRLGQIGDWAWDLRTGTMSWSEEHYRIFGRDPEQPPPTFDQLSSAYTPDSWERLKEAVDRARATGESYALELEVIHPDGERRWVAGRGQVERDPTDGQVVGLAGTAQDITDRRTLEAQFHQAQKMEAIGRLAGGVAHDFNNHLTAILGYSELLLDELGDHPLTAEVDEIRRAGEAAKRLTQQLLAFSRRQVIRPRVLDANDVLRATQKMFQRLIGEDVTLTLRLDPQLALIKVDAGQLEQVLMNLAVNARDAMPAGGSLTLETANVTLDKAFARRHRAAVAPGRYVMLAVTDTGCGMTPEVQQRLFEPFFTTKEQGKGTGLGLATVYGIVKQSGGYIWVYSEEGRGTTVKVHLPVVAEALRPVAAETVTTEPSAASETILLVEDNEQLRTLADLALRRLGYTVLVAADGPEAARLALDYTEPIHLLFTDVVMPGMGGASLFASVAMTRPALKVLYTSGYPNSAIVHQGVLAQGVAFLAKPYTPASLARKIRQVLDAPGRTPS